MGEKLEHRAADERRARLADDLVREQALARAQPDLLLEQRGLFALAAQHVVVGPGQVQQFATASPR
ncbi:hypothetical protein [Paraburkholderia sp. WSM4177]|uniref:hypothetical protein n=1 Tax=unclassified Paraburkholderia TaxID=2615204 RepID=UPI0017CBE678|nr:hypothetical protein [Paraburkholderia sp. WSM4177]MBB5487110.1 hypothetical protein [Paraburkholderia sp. WSM4180]